MNQYDNILKEICFALLTDNDDMFDENLINLSKYEKPVDALLTLFNENDDYLHEFHSIIHLIETLEPKEIYSSLAQNIIQFRWRSQHWSAYLISRILNSTPKENCQIDGKDFLLEFNKKGNDKAKTILKDIIKKLKNENKIKDVHLQSVNQFIEE